MDLKRLVNSDVPSQQTSEQSIGFVAPQQHAQTSAVHAHRPYAAHEQRQYSYEQTPSLSRQTSSGQYDRASRPPSLTPVNTQYIQQTSQSPTSYHSAQPSPYSARSARPPSHGKDRLPGTPLQLQPPSNAFAQQPHALSPTPSSQRSQTPQSVQHSPMPTIQYGPPHTTQQHNFAPPSINQTRAIIPPPYFDSRSSPQQARGSLPPVHRMGVDQIATSTGQQQAHRRSSGQQAYGHERESSVDVSPKSMPMPRPPSLASHQSSQNDEAYNSDPNSHRHVMSQPPSSHHHISPLQTSPPTQQRPEIRRSHTMEMSHLLTPSTESASTPFTQGSSKQEVETIQNGGAHKMEAQSHESKKRAPEDLIDSSRPAKKERTRRHLERPVWAQLSRRNPRCTGGPMQKELQLSRGAASSSSSNGAVKAVQQQQQQLQRGAIQNGAKQNAKVNYEQPWQNAIPYDMDLIRAREVLGGWEKSIKWVTPYPDILGAVQDWLVLHLQDHRDILDNPTLGSVEIEAKIGRLIKSGTGLPASLPVRNMTVLDPAVNRDYRFESELEEVDFKILNAFLNTTLLASRQPGRKGMVYGRVLEVDSFAHLSPAAQAALPHSIRLHNMHGRELKLRSTEDVKSGQTIARIVKVPLADLHIYNPAGYDCRISMNAEVNMMQPGVHADSLTIPATEEKPLPPSRRKDRLSYQHLAYQIDLTNVQVSGLAPKYEMEIEVNAAILSKQMQLLADDKPNALGDVVSGFLDNATFLMRQQRQK